MCLWSSETSQSNGENIFEKDVVSNAPDQRNTMLEMWMVLEQLYIQFIF